MKKVLAKKGDDVIPFDWETGECSFNNQGFKDILELCNGGKKDEEQEIDDDEFYQQLDDIEKK